MGEVWLNDSWCFLEIDLYCRERFSCLVFCKEFYLWRDISNGIPTGTKELYEIGTLESEEVMEPKSIRDKCIISAETVSLTVHIKE